MSVAGCGVGAADEPQGQPPPLDPVAESTEPLSSSGQTCHGSCNGGSYPLCYPNITVNCREQVVNACHRRGLSFHNAWWSYWGCSQPPHCNSSPGETPCG
ncbi:MAG: hypothetical protein IPJ65_15495 [Archangiaceae bacterium]|nr:hypothetical protein [Archangiaceae bacterium]